MKETTQGEQHRSVTLHQALVALERHLNTQANSLEKKRCSKNNASHWKARGGQEALRQTAQHVRGMRREHRSLLALHQDLSGYLICLEKMCGDAQEERRKPAPKRGMPVEKWKAEGEYQVLVPACVRLATLLQVFTPSAETGEPHRAYPDTEGGEDLECSAAKELLAGLRAC